MAACDYRIVKVRSDDTLSVRSGPGVRYLKVGAIPFDGTGIQITGAQRKIGKSRWLPIKYQEIEGWVNRRYLAEGANCQIFDDAHGPDCYRVVKVRSDDMLWIRSKPGIKSQRVGAIPYNGTQIQITGAEIRREKPRWVPIRYKDIEGWVNRGYLEEDCSLGTLAAGESGYHIVLPGDTLFSLSQRYGFRAKEIAGWNNLQPSDNDLSAGQRLRIVPLCYYRIVKVLLSDILWIRSGPNVRSQRVGAIPPNSTEIEIIGPEKQVRETRWVPIKYKNIEGWVSRSYLEEGC
jgi:uncharacterized protein YraI